MIEILNKWPDVPPMSLQFAKIAYNPHYGGKASNDGEFSHLESEGQVFSLFRNVGKVRESEPSSVIWIKVGKIQNPPVATPCRFESGHRHHLYKAKKMPPPKNRATARFFGVQEAKKRPSRDDVFWEMPPRFLGSEPSHRPKPSPTETAKERILEKAHRKNLWAFSHFWTNFQGCMTGCRALQIT